MSGDNLYGKQPDIRYNALVHHHEEWEKLPVSEKVKILIDSIEKWEHEYLTDNRNKLSEQQIDILQGRKLKSSEGMIYGQMYNDWKLQKGFKWE